MSVIYFSYRYVISWMMFSPFQEDGLFDHAQGNDFSMFDNLDSFLKEFGDSVSQPGSSPSPPPSDSGLSNTSSDQMMSPDDNGDDDLSEWIITLLGHQFSVFDVTHNPSCIG